ncbi:MAG: hypothetical protein QS721_06060 [Candidatus Endonucleobacter sp. (ex Gigantidas childressi)]|nr:hypothetical protein [Candidatus Endonucleobacter sp. (ex Gigantidas childressi)]
MKDVSSLAKKLKAHLPLHQARITFIAQFIMALLRVPCSRRVSDEGRQRVQLSPYIPVSFQVATLFSAFAHPSHLLLVGSLGFAYVLPSRNLKCFGYKAIFR